MMHLPRAKENTRSYCFEVASSSRILSSLDMGTYACEVIPRTGVISSASRLWFSVLGNSLVSSFEASLSDLQLAAK